MNDDNLPAVLGLAHSARFRQMSTRYPRRVAEAYAGDLGRAMGDSDEQVAATVAAWERARGLPPRDWRAIGAEERDEIRAAGAWGRAGTPTVSGSVPPWPPFR